MTIMWSFGQLAFADWILHFDEFSHQKQQSADVNKTFIHRTADSITYYKLSFFF